jgi:hypothetical protein
VRVVREPLSNQAASDEVAAHVTAGTGYRVAVLEGVPPSHWEPGFRQRIQHRVRRSRNAIQARVSWWPSDPGGPTRWLRESINPGLGFTPERPAFTRPVINPGLGSPGLGSESPRPVINPGLGSEPDPGLGSDSPPHLNGYQ